MLVSHGMQMLGRSGGWGSARIEDHVGLKEHLVELAVYAQDLVFGSGETEEPAAKTGFHGLEVMAVTHVDGSVDCEDSGE